MSTYLSALKQKWHGFREWLAREKIQIQVIDMHKTKILTQDNAELLSLEGVIVDKDNRKVIKVGSSRKPSRAVTCPESWFTCIMNDRHVNVKFALLNNQEKVIVITKPEAEKIV